MVAVFGLLMVFSGALCVAAEKAEKPTIIWKSGTLVPKGTGYASQVKEILDPGLLEVTDGNLLLKTYYGGVMGDDEDAFKKLHIGQLQACGLSAQGTMIACPEMGVVGLPFLFEGYDEVDFIKNKMYPMFESILASRNIHLLLWLDQGFDQFYSSRYPFSNLEQFRQAKFLTWYGVMEERVLKNLGAMPIPVNVPEFNTSLRQGVADSYIGPPIWCVATQLYSVIRFINNTNVRYSPAIFLVSSRAWTALPEKYQKSITRARGSWQKQFCEASRKDNNKCLAALFGYGVKEVKPDPALLKEMKEKTRPVWREMTGVLYSKDLLDHVLSYLEEYRKSKAR